jgi:excisionase family DNA binding protein
MAGLHPPVVDASPDELLTQLQVAELLKVTVPTVRAKIGSGELPAYRLGQRVVRVRRGDVDRLLTPMSASPKIEAAVQKSVDAAPALTPDQLEKIAALLRIGGAAG